MRFLIGLTWSPKPLNAAVKDGTVGLKLNRILGATKPESVYFTGQNGKRGAVMMPEDLQHAGLEGMGEKWS